MEQHLVHEERGVVAVLGNLDQLGSEPPVDPRLLIGIPAPPVGGVCEDWTVQCLFKVVEIPESNTP